MKTITQMARKMQQVLYTEANEIAWKTGFMERERKVTGSSFVVGLVSAWQNNPDVSLAGLSQAIGNAGTPITRQGLNQRFTPEAAELMRRMVEVSLRVVVRDIAVPSSLLDRFSAVELTDSTIITLPDELSEIWRGSGGYGQAAREAGLKLSVRWNMTNGHLTQLNLQHSMAHDRRAAAHHAPVQPGSLQLRDLGYFKLDDLEKIGFQGAYWLIRHKLGTHLHDLDGNRLNLEAWLPQQIGQRIDTSVLVGKDKQLPARLVAERVPADVVAQRHQRLHDVARKRQRPPSQHALEMAHWTLYLTNLPPALLSAEEVFLMGRYRWQIELLFKLWKSDLGMDRWRSTNPNRILCEVYAKLLAAIVTHWFLLIGCWHHPRRSLRQAMPTIHGLAWQWANSLPSATSTDLVGEQIMGAGVVMATEPVAQDVHCERVCAGFKNRPLAMQPAGFNWVEPGAFLGKQPDQ